MYYLPAKFPLLDLYVLQELTIESPLPSSSAESWISRTNLRQQELARQTSPNYLTWFSTEGLVVSADRAAGRILTAIGLGLTRKRVLRLKAACARLVRSKPPLS
jgi:hypothetical protein